VRNTPIEVLEMKTGMFIESAELECDSGGAGTYRGGLGLRRLIRFRTLGEFLSVTKKTKSNPWSLAGGKESSPNAILLRAGSPSEKRVGTYRSKVTPDQLVLCISGGGAGYGPPQRRDPAAVLEDVLDGNVSLAAARDLYRVVIVDGAVDQLATRALRATV